MVVVFEARLMTMAMCYGVKPASTLRQVTAVFSFLLSFKLQYTNLPFSSFAVHLRNSISSAFFRQASIYFKLTTRVQTI